MLLRFVCFLLCMAVAAPACAADRIVAVVNKEVITQKDLESFTNFTRIQLSQKLSGPQLDARVASMKSDLLQRLIEDKLILQEAKRQDIKVDESRVDAKLNEVKKRYDSDREFIDALLEQGLSLVDLESRIRDQMLMYALIDHEIREKIHLKPAEITEYYNQHKGEFVILESREMSSVSFEKEEQAKKFADEVRQRAGDINAVAAEQSLKVSRFNAKAGELKAELEAVLFAMKPQEVSDPQLVNGSFYVFKIDAVNPAHQQSLAEVQDELSNELYEKKLQEGVVVWLDGLKKKSFVRIMDNNPEPQAQNPPE